jgi:predicted DNA-binding transcriptional regulator AlpA
MYIGISVAKFDEMVADGRMPAPVRIDGRKIWDIRAIDLAFDALSRDDCGGNSWGDV